MFFEWVTIETMLYRTHNTVQRNYRPYAINDIFTLPYSPTATNMIHIKLLNTETAIRHREMHKNVATITKFLIPDLKLYERHI